MKEKKEKKVFTTISIPVFLHERLNDLKIFSADSFADVIIALIMDRKLLRAELDAIKRNDSYAEHLVSDLREQITSLRGASQLLTDQEEEEEEDYGLTDEGKEAAYKSTILSTDPDEYEEKIAQSRERNEKLKEIKKKFHEEKV